MAKYWVYLNDQVVGPFTIEQLIRQRGFSRQTQICVDDNSGHPSQWTSPAEIPELAHIFKAADGWSEPPVPSPAPRAAPKTPAPRPTPRSTPAVVLVPKPSASKAWWLIPLLCVLAASGFGWFRYQEKQSRQREQGLARQMVET